MNFQITMAQTILIFAHLRVRRNEILTAFTAGLLFVVQARASNPNQLADAQIAQQIQAIHNDQLSICLPAIEALGRAKNPAAVKPLADAFVLENRPVVRRYLVDALGNLRNRAAIPALKQALNDSDVQVRQSAVAAVGLLGAADQQVLLLDQAASEKNPVIKRQMVHHLGLLHTSESKKALKTFSQDNDATVRDMAGNGLSKEPQNKP